MEKLKPDDGVSSKISLSREEKQEEEVKEEAEQTCQHVLQATVQLLLAPACQNVANSCSGLLPAAADGPSDVSPS